MTKREIPKAKDNELIVDYVRTQTLLEANLITGRGIKQLLAHAHDLENELVKRGLLTEADVKYLNS